MDAAVDKRPLADPASAERTREDWASAERTREDWASAERTREDAASAERTLEDWADAMARDFLLFAILVLGATSVGAQAHGALSMDSEQKGQGAVEDTAGEVAPDDAALLKDAEDPSDVPVAEPKRRTDGDEQRENESDAVSSNLVPDKRALADLAPGKRALADLAPGKRALADLAPTIVVPPDESTLSEIEDDVLLVPPNAFLPAIQATAAAAIGLLVGVLVPGTLMTVTFLSAGIALWGPAIFNGAGTFTSTVALVVGASLALSIPLSPCGVGAVTCANAIVNEQSLVSSMFAVGVGGAMTLASMAAFMGACFAGPLQQPLGYAGVVGLLTAGLASVATVGITELALKELANTKLPKSFRASTSPPRVITAAGGRRPAEAPPEGGARREVASIPIRY